MNKKIWLMSGVLVVVVVGAYFVAGSGLEGSFMSDKGYRKAQSTAPSSNNPTSTVDIQGAILPDISISDVTLDKGDMNGFDILNIALVSEGRSTKKTDMVVKINGIKYSEYEIGLESKKVKIDLPISTVCSAGIVVPLVEVLIDTKNILKESNESNNYTVVESGSSASTIMCSNSNQDLALNGCMFALRLDQFLAGSLIQPAGYYGKGTTYTAAASTCKKVIASLAKKGIHTQGLSLGQVVTRSDIMYNIKEALKLKGKVFPDNIPDIAVYFSNDNTLIVAPKEASYYTGIQAVAYQLNLIGKKNLLEIANGVFGMNLTATTSWVVDVLNALK